MIYGRSRIANTRICRNALQSRNRSALILDSNGRILGLLDASCSNEARQQHTHALVRMAAARVENGLIFQERTECFILAFNPSAEYLDTLSAGLVAVSRDGKVISLDRPGTSLLAGLPASAGSHFDQLFEASFGATISGLLNGGVTTIRGRAGSDVFMVCRQIAPGGRISPARPSGVAPAAHVERECAEILPVQVLLRPHGPHRCYAVESQNRFKGVSPGIEYRNLRRKINQPSTQEADGTVGWDHYAIYSVVFCLLFPLRQRICITIGVTNCITTYVPAVPRPAL